MVESEKPTHRLSKQKKGEGNEMGKPFSFWARKVQDGVLSRISLWTCRITVLAGNGGRVNGTLSFV